MFWIGVALARRRAVAARTGSGAARARSAASGAPARGDAARGGAAAAVGARGVPVAAGRLRTLDERVGDAPVRLAAVAGRGGWERESVPASPTGRPRFVGARAADHAVLPKGGRDASACYLAYYRDQRRGQELVSSQNVLVRDSEHALASGARAVRRSCPCGGRAARGRRPRMLHGAVPPRLAVLATGTGSTAGSRRASTWRSCCWRLAKLQRPRRRRRGDHRLHAPYPRARRRGRRAALRELRPRHARRRSTPRSRAGGVAPDDATTPSDRARSSRTSSTASTSAASRTAWST